MYNVCWIVIKPLQNKPFHGEIISLKLDQKQEGGLEIIGKIISLYDTKYLGHFPNLEFLFWWIGQDFRVLDSGRFGRTGIYGRGWW